MQALVIILFLAYYLKSDGKDISCVFILQDVQSTELSAQLNLSFYSMGDNFLQLVSV